MTTDTFSSPHRESPNSFENAYRTVILLADAIPYERTPGAENYLFIGDRIEELTGYKPAEFTLGLLRGMMREIRVQGNLEGMTVAQAEKKFFAGEEHIWRSSMRIVNRRNETRWLEDSSVWHVLPSTGERRIVGILQDITARMLAQNALAASEKRFRTYVEASSLGFAVVSPNRTWTDANPRFCEMLGRSREELGNLTWMDLTHPDDVPAEEALFSRALAREIEWYSIEKRFVRPDQTVVEAMVSARLLRQPTGVADLFVLAIHDVTAQRQIERSLRESQAQLVQAQKMEAVGRLAGGVAHDFNNLLTIILGYADILLEGRPDDDPDRPLLEEMHAAGEKATALVRQLLLISRKQFMHPRPVDLNLVISDLGKMLRRMIGEHISVHLRLDPNPKPVFADPAQIEQLLLNLCVNSRDAMPGGGRIILGTESVEFAGSTTGPFMDLCPGTYVALTVSDTGMGIPPDVLPHIFEPFYTTKDSTFGTGLGLSTAYGIVKLLGGGVAVTTEAGKGTEFRILLPVWDSRTDSGSGSDARDGEPGRGTERILFVEDEDGVRRMASRALAKVGYEVATAACGADALAWLDEHEGNVQLVVSDIVMPGMSGRVLAEQIRTRYPGMPILLISGYADTSAIGESASSPSEAFAFLEKPFTPPQLIARVREVLQRSGG